MNKPVDFDNFTHNYNELLGESTRFFTSDEEYFASYKIDIVHRMIQGPVTRILEFGCGIGRNIPFLKAAFPNASICGSDLAPASLEIARNENKEVDFFLEDNNEPEMGAFDLIVVAGVFHHIPSFELRLKMIKYLLSKLSSDGYLIISLWQFMDYQRFKKKVINDQSTLNAKNIKLINLEKNDFILDWNRGETALRFCHFIDKSEQLKLINMSSSKLIDQFRADGKEEDVNQYLILSNNL